MEALEAPKSQPCEDLSLTVTAHTDSLIRKATEEDTKKIMSYMKKANLYFSAPRYKSLENFIAMLKERKPHVCASWFGSSIVQDEIKNSATLCILILMKELPIIKNLREKQKSVFILYKGHLHG